MRDGRAAKGGECAATLRNSPDARPLDLQRPPMRENAPKSRIGGPSLQIYRALEAFGRTGRAGGPMRVPPPPLREGWLPTAYATIRQRYR